MLWLLVFPLLLFGQISATSILLFDGCELSEAKKAKLLEIVFKGEPPRVFYDREPINIEAEVHALDSKIRLEWIPPTLWQIAALHSFFADVEIRRYVTQLPGPWWNPLSYDEKLNSYLHAVTSHDQVVRLFDSHSKSLPDIEELYFRVNNAIANVYLRAGKSDSKMLDILLHEIPQFSKWATMQFPFWWCPYVQKPEAAELFYKALTNTHLIAEFVKMERAAYEKGEWILYRGYKGVALPSTIEIGTAESHALSFGSTLLGGVFFSMEATALTYCAPDISDEWSFLVLSVTPDELKKFFRVGPIHPLIQMLSDGEMFHAHTKIAATAPDTYFDKQLYGYFMKSNRYCYDKIGYILTFDMTTDELEKEFQLLCERSARVYSWKK